MDFNWMDFQDLLTLHVKSNHGHRLDWPWLDRKRTMETGVNHATVTKWPGYLNRVPGDD